MSAVVARHLTKVFAEGPTEVVALDDVSLEMAGGELVALTGPSGSGKTTLLRALSLIDPATRGRLTIDGERIAEDGHVFVDDRQLRRRKMGVIFQAYNLIPFLTVTENVAVVLTLDGIASQDARRRAHALLDRLGLAPCAGMHPATLSGGEQQRVAIARALVNRPAVVLADEPTAALDTARGRDVMALLRELGRDSGAAVIVVTHDERMLDGFDRVYRMTDGRLR